jgi:Ca2+-binding RTX toxin-like protein
MATLKWRNEFIVNTIQAGNQDQSAVTALADGGFVIAWRDDGPADSIVRWQRFDALGLKVGAEFNDSVSFVGDQSLPSIVQLNDGNLWIAQQDFDGAANRDGDGGIYNIDTGARISARTAIASANDEVDVRAASLGSGGSVAVWTDLSANTGDIKMHGISTIGGDIFGTAAAGVTVNTNGAGAGAQVAPEVAASKDGQRFVVVWQDDNLNIGDIRARIFDNGGGQITAEFGVNVFTSSSQQAPSVVWLTPTKFVAVWHSFDPSSGDGSSTAIKYVIRNLDGTLQGSERLANSSTHDVQLNPAVCALNDGGFAIAWTDSSLSGPDTSRAIRLQVFDGAGEKRGAEIVVNTTTNSDQFEPSLATLADGRIAVSWTDFSTSIAGDGTTVRAQVVDPRDGVVDGTAQADTLRGHDAFGDMISGYDGDDMLHGLAGNDQLYGGAGIDVAFGGKGDDTAYGGDGNDFLAGDAGDDDLFGEDGNDDLRGGSGADAFDGGAGNDLVNYGLALASVTAALDASAAGTGDAAGDTFLSIENLKGANIAGGVDRLTGNGDNNTIFGNDGNDIINGRAGLDKLFGGLGADQLRGELGNDEFVYNALAEGGDTLLDFTSNAAGNNDVVKIKASGFGGGLAAGGLAANQFEANTTGAATLGTTRFVYDTDDEVLSFDLNGSTAGGVTAIATLQNGAVLALADIVIF